MLHAGVNHIIAALLYPPQLQIDAVNDYNAFVAVYEIVKAAIQTLKFTQLRDGCLVRTIDENIFCESPIIFTLIEESNEADSCITGGQWHIQIGIVIHLLSKGI